MTRKYFKLSYLLLIVLLSGCTVDYGLYFNDSNITEVIEVYDDTSGININKVVNNVKNEYGSLYDIDMYTDLADCGNLCVDKVSIGISTYKEYTKVKNYINSLAISQYFGKILFVNDDDVYTFTAVPNTAFANLLSDGKYNKASVERVNISIFVPYKVISHNASSVNGNTYNFSYTFNNWDEEIKISYSLKDSDVNEEDINNLYDNNSSVELDNNVNKDEKIYNIGGYVLIVIGILLLILVMYFVSKNRKNNDL